MVDDSAVVREVMRAVLEREGDIVVSFDGRPVSRIADLHRLLVFEASGRPVAVGVIRDGGLRDVAVVPHEAP